MSADANIKIIAEIYEAFGGKAAQMNLHHYFRFRDGKIAYYRGAEDIAQTRAVLR